MSTDFGALYGHMCEFKRRPLLLFSIPELADETFARIAYSNSPVELVVPNLDDFCVPEEDLERIQWAIDAARASE
jgi:hypothetical protein